MGWNCLSIPKLQRFQRWSLKMENLFHPTFYCACYYLSMLGLKVNHASKGPHVCVLYEQLLSVCQALCKMYQAIPSVFIRLKYIFIYISDWNIYSYIYYKILPSNFELLYIVSSISHICGGSSKTICLWFNMPKLCYWLRHKTMPPFKEFYVAPAW